MAEAFPREKSVETTITALLAHSGDSSRLSSVRAEISEGLKLARALSRVLAIA
jgi:hypothetical protein